MKCEEGIDRERRARIKKYISNLSSCNTEISKCTEKELYYFDRSYFHDKLESKCLKTISDEHCKCLPIFLPHGEFASTILIIVHTWQIIMYKCEGMETLNSDRRSHQKIWRPLTRDDLICQTMQDRPETLPSSLDCIAHSTLIFS